MDEHGPKSTPQGSEADDFEAASRSTADYADFKPSTPLESPPRSSKKGLLIGGLVVLVLVAGGGAAWWLMHRKSNATTPSTATATNSSTATTTSNSPTAIATTTKHYSSTAFNLSFDYPNDWTASETTDKVTVHSPVLALKAADGRSTHGEVILTINHAGQNLSAFDAGNATAARESLKIAYTKPTDSQRANTYLSFVQYAKTTTAGALDGVYITGDNGYQKGQAIPKVDVAKGDPLITLTFVSCADDACVSPTPLSLAVSVWGDTSFAGPLTKMLESLAIS